MIEIGRIAIKIAGRDGGRECVIVDILDNNFVLIDGNVRRRKCNILHLEPTSRKIEIKKNASHEDVKKEFSKLKIDVWDTKAKQKGEKPVKIRGKKEVSEDVKKVKKEEKKKVKEEAKKEPVKEIKKAEEVKPAVKEEKPVAKEKQPIDARIISVTKKKTSKNKVEKKE